MAEIGVLSAVAPARATNIARLRGFVRDMAEVVDVESDEAAILTRGGALLEQLVSDDDWLPDAFAEPVPEGYAQYLLHCDSRERFSVVSFVWGPGVATAIHNHTVWGLVGVLRGRERSEGFTREADGTLTPGPVSYLASGGVEAVSPAKGDIHRVSNALADAPSISIHVYGGNIGALRRSTFTPDGATELFISGYANDVLPNLWDQSRFG
jgi:predicted metal-dependent enzyme (double-stranded beta helix superfamily)